MAIQTHTQENPMTGAPRIGLTLTSDELVGTPDVVVSVLLSTIQEAIHLARSANQSGTLFDLLRLEKAVADFATERWAAHDALEAWRQQEGV